MRIVPILIASIVMLSLFLFVFERDRLMDLAGINQTQATSDDAPVGAALTPATDQADDATTAAGDATDAPVPPALRDQTTDAVVKVVVQRSTASELDSAVILRGQSEAARTVQVAAETGGRVISEPLRKGAYVDAGQVLCELDAGTRSAALAQASAAVAEAEVALNNATKLAEGGFASETGVLRAEAALEAARAALAQSENDIDNLKVTAPFAGLLESDTAELGSLMQGGSLCATIIQLDPMKLVAYAPEAQVDRIEVGTLAGARFLTGKEVSGRVTFLSRSADPATRTFRVEIEVPNTDFAIRDGQTVEMAIRADGKSAHLVAQSSLTLNDEGLLGLRLVDDESKVDFVPVEVIRDSTDGVWVAGLPEAANIITVGQEYVRDGVQVEAHYKEASQ